MPDLPDLTLAEKQQLQTFLTYRKSFFRFCHDILGYHEMNEEHRALCDFLQYDPTPSKLILMPRHTFKSHIATIGYTLWRLTRNDSLRILIYSDVNEKAEGFLEGVKNQLEGKAPRSRFRAVYGAWETDPKSGVWNQAQIVIKPRQAAHVEPTYDTAGSETSKTGKHYDLIVFDDLVSEKTVTTPEQLQKSKEVYRKALSLLKPGGEVFVIGTRWHFGDLYGELLAKEEERARNGQAKVFAVHRRQAEVNGTYPFASINLTKAFLDHQKSEQGSYTYSALYQNNPTDDETAAFKAKDFAFYDPTWRNKTGWVDSLFITACIDPAISQAGGADDTAITVVGTDAKGDLYLLDIEGGKLLPDAMLDTLLQLHARWRITIVGVETTAFQRILVRDLQRRLDQERSKPGFRPFRIHEFTGVSSKSKEQRIMGLQPYHERGAIKLPGTRLELLTGKYQTLASQLLQFPRSPHDDYCFVAGTTIATLFGDKRIEDVRVGDRVLTPTGIRRVSAAGQTGERHVLTRAGLCGTPNHPVFVQGKGLTPLDALAYTDTVSRLTAQEVWTWQYQNLLSSMALPTGSWVGRDAIISASQQPIRGASVLKDFMWRYGKLLINGQYRQATTFIIKTVIRLITHQIIWNVYRVSNTVRCQSAWIGKRINNCWSAFDRCRQHGMVLLKDWSGIDRMREGLGRLAPRSLAYASNAGNGFGHGWRTPHFVLEPANKPVVEPVVGGTSLNPVPSAGKILPQTDTASGNAVHDSVAAPSVVPVFNLTVVQDGLYYANGVLVSNCDSLAYHTFIHRKGEVKATPQNIPVTSAAWFEREQRNRLIKVMARRPRWQREPIPELAFS